MYCIIMYSEDKRARGSQQDNGRFTLCLWADFEHIIDTCHGMWTPTCNRCIFKCFPLWYLIHHNVEYYCIIFERGARCMRCVMLFPPEHVWSRVQCIPRRPGCMVLLSMTETHTHSWCQMMHGQHRPTKFSPSVYWVWPRCLWRLHHLTHIVGGWYEVLLLCIIVWFPRWV